MLQKLLFNGRLAAQHAHTEHDASALFQCNTGIKKAPMFWIHVIEQDDCQKLSPLALCVAPMLETVRAACCARHVLCSNKGQCLPVRELELFRRCDRPVALEAPMAGAEWEEGGERRSRSWMLLQQLT